MSKIIHPVVLKNGWIPIETKNEKQALETNIITIITLSILTGGIYLGYWLYSWMADRKALNAHVISAPNPDPHSFNNLLPPKTEIPEPPAIDLTDAAISSASRKETESFNAFQKAFNVLLGIHRTLDKEKDLALLGIDENRTLKTELKKNDALNDTKANLKTYLTDAEEARAARRHDGDVTRIAETSKIAALRVQILVTAALNEDVKDKDLIQLLTIAARDTYFDVVNSYKKVGDINNINTTQIMEGIIKSLQKNTEHPILPQTNDLRRTEFVNSSKALMSSTLSKSIAYAAFKQLDPTIVDFT
jgi:hypothetical protein